MLKFRRQLQEGGAECNHCERTLLFEEMLFELGQNVIDGKPRASYCLDNLMQSPAAECFFLDPSTVTLQEMIGQGGFSKVYAG